MNAWEAINKAVQEDPSGDPYKIAESVVAGLVKSDLVPLVADEVAGAQRALARRAEVAAFRESMSSRSERAILSRCAIPEAFRALLDSPIRLGDGSGAVEWQYATVDQWKQRIAMLEKIRAGLDATISRCREVVAFLESTGARCLAEVEEAEAA